MMNKANKKKQKYALKSILKVFGKILKHFLLMAIVLSILFPVVWLFYTSLKSGKELFANPWALPKVIQWENYSRAWTKVHVGRYLMNSVFVTTISLSGILLLGAMASYILARFTFRGNKVIFFGFIASMMIPQFLGLVPLWFLLKSLGLLGGYIGLIPVYIAVSLPFSIFFLTAFFKTIAYEMEEAAIIDGCSNFGVFFRIMLPLAQSGLITVGIFNFLGIWNEYTTALVLITEEHLRTLPLGMAYLLQVSQYRTDWGALFAGLMIALIPTAITYIIFQGRLTKGITIGALKG